MAFGDINLSEQQIRGNHNPGAGGWPTVRYFNKETGYEGAPYTKKTSKSMCDELGDITYMEQYVMEAGGIHKCNIAKAEGCNEKELGYIKTWSAKSADEVTEQLKRLKEMKNSKVAANLVEWINQRISILSQLAEQRSSGEL